MITRTATPLFIFMFGMMMEVAYVRRATRDGLSLATLRLLKRSAQCYLGYALTVIAGAIGGYMSFEEGVLALAFLQNAHYGNILRLYTVALAIAPALVWLRLRFGPRFLVVALLIVWSGDIFFLNYIDGDFGLLNQWFNIVLGAGVVTGGPSVWHGFTFILTGMFVATGLQHWREEGLKQFYRHGLVILTVSGVAIAYLCVTYGVLGVLHQFIEYSAFRAHNHFGYYAIGVAACLLTLFSLCLTIPQGKLPPWSGVLMQFGKASLFSYSLGNILLNLVPRDTMVKGFGNAAIPFAVVFILLMLAIVNWQLVLRAAFPASFKPIRQRAMRS